MMSARFRVLRFLKQFILEGVGVVYLEAMWSLIKVVAEMYGIAPFQ